MKMSKTSAKILYILWLLSFGFLLLNLLPEKAFAALIVIIVYGILFFLFLKIELTDN